MCQLNLEIRNTKKATIPVFHFSKILALALGAEDYEAWFVRHIVDPRPLVERLAVQPKDEHRGKEHTLRMY
jgi:heterodisulfide reductase subunit B